MDKLKISLKNIDDNSYPIYIGNALLSNSIELLISQFYTGKDIVVITDKTVSKLYAKNFVDYLMNKEYKVLLLEVKPGESSKSAAVKEKIELKMLENKIDRYCLCIAFGGGVVGDLAGFIAATYMRGIKYIQIPTTLLSMVDSSVGGKTAINTIFGKNLIGAFHQPKAVIIDLNLLNTLPKKHLINGLIEAIKIFLTLDESSFKFVENNLDLILGLDKETLIFVIKKAISLKANIIERDEKEKNLRLILNLGHTIGHAIETVTNYKILHGYAVALGIIIEAQLALVMGKLNKSDYIKIINLFKRLKITMKLLSNKNIENIAKATLIDKKNKNNEIYCVLLKKVGKVILNQKSVISKVDYKDILQAFKNVR